MAAANPNVQTAPKYILKKNIHTLIPPWIAIFWMQPGSRTPKWKYYDLHFQLKAFIHLKSDILNNLYIWALIKCFLWYMALAFLLWLPERIESINVIDSIVLKILSQTSYLDVGRMLFDFFTKSVDLEFLTKW